MITMVTMETKYTAPLSQLYHPLYLLYLPDLSLSWAFLSSLSVLLSSIIFVIIVYYLRIITMKKLINLDCLACYYRYAYFVFVDSLSARVGPTFDSICSVGKFFSRIL